MELFELIAPCHFGTERTTKREITDLGYDVIRVEDGKVTFSGDAQAIADANLFLRTPERILLKAAEFEAVTFDELYEKTKAVPWERFIPKDGRFWVTKANSVKSRLFSPSDIQSIMKKAMVDHLRGVYHRNRFEETGASYPMRVSILKDRVTIGIDTTGTSLHKRGYRKRTVAAPITETLAASLLMLTPWKQDRILVDPFCGSGTFPIEAAMMAAHMAPGRNRSFLSEAWENIIPKSCWENAREEADDLADPQIKTDIQGYDIDENAIRAAMENAELAGVRGMIHLQKRPVSELSHHGKYGFIITNPPYGERLEDKEALPELYRTLGERYAALDDWSMYVITAYEDAERYLGRKADRNRKIYNGMIKAYFYQYQGKKPPKRPFPEKHLN